MAVRTSSDWACPRAAVIVSRHSVSDIEQQIVEWASTRPAWQQAVLYRIASGQTLVDTDYEALADSLTSGGTANEQDSTTQLRVEHMPSSSADGAPVRLLSLSDTRHVNALCGGQPLTFAPGGMTVVYGDNASGKSGYARLIKKVVRALHAEDVLTDIFTDRGDEVPSARLKFRIGHSDDEVDWPAVNNPALAQIGFYDEACGESYITRDLEIGYRPSALFVLDGLIRVCDSVRSELDRRLAENLRARTELPEVLPGTTAAAFLEQLTASTSDAALETICELPANIDEEIARLIQDENRLRTTNPQKERAKLQAIATKLEKVADHLDRCAAETGPRRETELAECYNAFVGARAAADVASKLSFDAEPVSGVGSDAWRALWEAARAFSVQEAKLGADFPALDKGARCVLCHQELQHDAAERMRRFESFVQNKTQRDLEDARETWRRCRSTVEAFVVIPADVQARLDELKDDHTDLVSACRELLASFESRKDALLASQGHDAWKPVSQRPPEPLQRSPRVVALELRGEADGLEDSEFEKRLAEVTELRRGLEARKQLASKRSVVEAELNRLRLRGRIEEAKDQTATGAISKKAAELARSHVTTVIRDRFTRETDRLRLEKVTIADVGGKKGSLRHQTAFVGALQDAPLPKVLSEGEQTALGLAGFFTEAYLDTSKSGIVLDDPVCSLDHVRRGRVAIRLAEFAKERQVVVFTHDVAFVGELSRAAQESQVEFVERSVERLGSGAPGACRETHPWKAKDAGQRLHKLEADVARIKRERDQVDQSTYERETTEWAGQLSETWERMIALEVAGQVFDFGTQEVRPMKFRVLTRITETDEQEFQKGYGRCSQWARRHDKSPAVNYVAPTIDDLEAELKRARDWYDRVRKYRN